MIDSGFITTYTIKPDGKVWYKGDQTVKTETQSDETKFLIPRTSSNITKPYTIKSTGYEYYPETLGDFSSSKVNEGQLLEGILKSTPEYDMLFKTQFNFPYLFATPCLWAYPGYVKWSLFIVTATGVVSNCGLSVSNASIWGGIFGVRPVVSLKSTITPNFVSKDESTGISTYEI